MKSDYDVAARKRPVNLTLNEDLVKHVKGLTDNLSRVVESLLSGYLAKAREEQLAKSAPAEATVKVGTTSMRSPGRSAMSTRRSDGAVRCPPEYRETQGHHPLRRCSAIRSVR